MPALVVKGSSVEGRFHSDGSNNDWGYRFSVTPVPPSLSLLCAPLSAVISSILLQNMTVNTSEADSPESNSDCLLAQHSQLVRSGSASADTPAVFSALNFLRDFDVLDSIRHSTFTRPHLIRVVSSMFAEFLALCQQPSQIEEHILLFSRSLDACTKSIIGKSSSNVIDSTVKADGSAYTFKHDEIEASSNFIDNITSSSSSGMTRSLLSSDWETFWQSEGQQGTHWICVQLKDGIFAKDVGICVQSDDQSWCPKG